WNDKKEPNELSAVQSAMNKFYSDRKAFFAEGQNAPEVDGGPAGAKELVPAQVTKRLSGCDRWAVPPDASRLTAFIDCGGGKGRGLWYAVCAWTEGFGGSVIDYGTWPRQSRSVFAANDMRPGLAELYPQLSVSERLYAGLEALSAEVLGREYARERDGARMRIERCLVDAGWEPKTVYTWCRQTPHYGVVMPSKGIARTKTASGVAEWKPRPGEPRPGYHWRITTSETGMGRMVQFDTDAWKSVVWERFTAPLGGSGCLHLWGRAGPNAPLHELLGDHLAAETAEPVTIRGSTFDKWSERPHHPDNHWLDCVVGCAVGASVQGVNFDPGTASGAKPPEVPTVKAMSFSEMQRAARAAREKTGGRR
ncbi:MAG TPA: terminase gpA endonuclease subunit, partial [Gemmata sp.]